MSTAFRINPHFLFWPSGTCNLVPVYLLLPPHLRPPPSHCIPVTLASFRFLNCPSSFMPSGFLRKYFFCPEYSSSRTFHGGLFLDTQVSFTVLPSQKSIGWLPVSSGVRLPGLSFLTCFPSASFQLMSSWEQDLCLSSYHHILST